MIFGNNLMKKGEARELYQTAVKLREHWYRVVWTYTGFAITINAGIWSYLLKGYVDSITVDPPLGNPLYIGIAAAISSVIFGVWRYHNRQVDDVSFGLLIDLLRYEMMIGAPKYSGTQGDLIRTRPAMRGLVFGNSQLSREQKLKVINQLVEDKHMGWRKSLILEWSIFVLMIFMLIATSVLFKIYQLQQSPNALEEYLAVLCIIGILIGFFIVVYEISWLHSEPDEHSIKQAINKIKKVRT